MDDLLILTLFLHRCGQIVSERAKYEDRNCAVAREHLRELDQEQALHDAEHLGERNYAEDIWFKAEEMPHRVTCVSMDAPTEYQFDVPVQPRLAHDPVKALDGAKKWSSKVMGSYVAGWGIRAYLARDGLGSGANLSCTVLYLTLLAMVAAGRQFGSCFTVLLDNTSADNKNNAMIFFLGWLVAMGIFEETTTFMMMKGHTYSRIDQSFRTIIVQIFSTAAWTVGMLMQHIFRFLQPYNCLAVEELPHLWNWGDYFAPHVEEKFGGFCTSQYGAGMHEIRCRKDKDGNVRVWLRASSASSTWLPEGDGYLMFKSLPDGEPPIAKGKTDREWRRDVVQSTVRSWYKYMHVSQNALTKIRAEWETRFDSLPPDGDMNQLPAEKRMKWTPLPVRTCATVHSQSESRARHFSSALENPPINPVTGPGRTAADVARELNSYRATQRRLCGGLGDGTQTNYPIFQADFLLIRKSSDAGHVALHRVTHGLTLEDATNSEISFTTTEYEHSPQDGVQGLWGTFLPKV